LDRAAVYAMSDIAYTAAVHATPDITYTTAILYTNVAMSYLYVLSLLTIIPHPNPTFQLGSR